MRVRAFRVRAQVNNFRQPTRQRRKERKRPQVVGAYEQ